MVGLERLELSRLAPRDFKSHMSTIPPQPHEKLMVGRTGIEPAPRKRLEPKSSASAYSATGPSLIFHSYNNNKNIEKSQELFYKMVNLTKARPILIIPKALAAPFERSIIPLPGILSFILTITDLPVLL